MDKNSLKVVSESQVTVSPSKDKVVPEPSENFVSTSHVAELTQRALAYLKVGYPVHFAGPPGTGKTTLAFHIAAQLGQSVTLIHGDDEFGSSDLIGRDHGYQKYKLHDNYVRSVVKTEERMNTLWMDNRLTTACEKGYTLIYDEFTRSRPEANNALLSILEEKILNLPSIRNSGEGYMRVSPDFRAIFTSNPEEYAGVHKTQDALMDRLITINLGHFDRETEVAICRAKSSLEAYDVEVIVDIVRALRGEGVSNSRPTIRSSIAISRILAHFGGGAMLNNPVFRKVCRDVLNTDSMKVFHDGRSQMPRKVEEVISMVCGKKEKAAKKG